MNRARVKRWRERHPWLAKEQAKLRYQKSEKDLTRNSWRGMLDRCRREGHIGWARYGGRGIKVCERWSLYENFLADMGPRPGREWTIHRIDNDKGYEPGNCRWATKREQMESFRANHPHGMSPRQYERKLAANKRYRQRNPEKFREYKRQARLRNKGARTVGEELALIEFS